MQRIPTVLLVCLVIAPPLRAQEKSTRTRHVMALLNKEQKDLANQLQSRVKEMTTLIGDLRRRGETHKADLLQGVLAIVTSKNIDIDASENRQLADLRSVMIQMAKTLQERPDATGEVAELVEKVIAVLDTIVARLLDKDDLSSLEDREKTMRDIRDKARELARRQAELKRRTRRSVPRTDAEKAAEAADEQLGELERELNKLEQDARRTLRELERAREWATSLKELADRQKRIRSETLVRSGKADRITSAMNRAMAELDAVRRAATRAAKDQAEKAVVSELATEVGKLADRQQALAGEIADRARLERLERALARGPAAPDRELLERAARGSQGELAKALEEAAKKPRDPVARGRALKAIRDALEKTPSKESLARDQRALARAVARAMERAPEIAGEAAQRAAGELSRAREQADRSARRLEAGTDAEEPARNAADALKKAKAALDKVAGNQAGKAGRQAEALKRAAKRARQLAADLGKLAGEKATRNAGLGGLVEEAQAAADKAGKELEQAAEATGRGAARRAREEAKAAGERTELALGELSDAMQERQDLARRQGKIGEDLKGLAARSDAKPGRADALKKAAAKAAAAKADLRKGEHAKAAAKQQEIVDQLEALSAKAQAAVKRTAARQKGALQMARERTRRAAGKAGEIAGQLERAKAQAKEKDSRRRLDAASAATRKAEESLRRSLKKLRDLMPKGAEQERRDAQDQVAAARRNLKGLRERRGKPDPAAKNSMKRISKQQGGLEEEVKRLEERLRKMKEKSGVEQLQDAQSAMREARRQLDQGDADQAEKNQERAEKLLKQAQKDLDKEERRYRTLRQYELLFKLKEELKAFRRQAQAHRETLQEIHAKVKAAGRVSRFLNRKDIRPLRRRIKLLARDVSGKAEAIEKERAIVYTYILKGCATDLDEIEGQLSMKQVGLVPQEMLGDIVRRFDLAIRGLERNLRERQDEKQKQQQGGKKKQQPGNTKPLLVPQNAEVRMVMVLQQALNREREDFFASRPDFGSRPSTARERARLQRLYHQQGSLAELFDSVREALVGGQGGQDHEFGEKPGEEEGR